MDEFSKSIKKYIDPTDDDLKKILGRFQIKKIRKGSYLVRSGQTTNEFFFIVEGCLRVFWERDNKEITGWFAFEQEFFCEISSFIPQKASAFGVQAIENTTVFYILRNEMEKLFKEVPVFETFVRKLWEKIITQLVRNIISFQSETAEKRYEKAMRHPKLLQRVPLKYLSSYLGVTPSSLSRLRKLK